MAPFPLNSMIKCATIFFLIFCSLPIEECQGDKILIFVPIGHSHRQSIEPLANKLQTKGHQVTIFSAEKATKLNPKIREFCPQQLTTYVKTTVQDVALHALQIRAFSKYLHILPSVWAAIYFDLSLCSLILNSPDFQTWVKSSTTSFDLVIVDHSSYKCAFGLAYKFNASLIAFSPTGILSHENEIWGWHSDSSWAPTFALSNLFSTERTFYDRLFLTVYPLFLKLVINSIVIPIDDRITRETLDIPEMPSLAELEENASLYFVNLHPSSDYPRSFPPFVVPVGGMHCDVWENRNRNQNTNTTGKLPQKMADFIDGAGEDGFILISFGTVLSQMSRLPEDYLHAFFEAIRGRKTRFLWKWDVDPPENTPENIFTASWFPQQDILAHPKIRGFITHGGMMSYQQSIANGVPVIVMPIVFDQPFNAFHSETHLEMGVHLEFAELTVETLTRAIDSILYDKKYKENAIKAQARFLDRPQPPVDLALYWTEYVLHHKDTSHLKPTQAMAQYWWQRHLLDVWLFILILTILSSWTAVKILLIIFRSVSNMKSGIKPKTE